MTTNSLCQYPLSASRKNQCGPVVFAALRPVARLRRHVLELDVVADLEVRQGQRRLAGDRLRLEHLSVGLDDAQVQHETGGRLGLRLRVDRLLRLELLDLVLEHLARAVFVDPDRGVVEDARRGAVHVMARLLPGLVLADDGAPVLAIRLEVGRSLDDVDGGAQLVGAGAGLKGARERTPQRGSVALRVREIGEAKASLHVARVLRESLLELLRRRAGIARAREDVGDPGRDLFPVGTPTS